MTARRRSGIVRLFIFLALLTAIVAGLVFIAGRLLSPSFVSEQLSAAVERSTGRKLDISGRPVLTFWPELSIRLQDVTLSNPPDMYDGAFLRIGELELVVDAKALLQRRLEVRRIVLKRPRVTLLVDRKGLANWRFGGDGHSAAGKGEATTDAGGLLQDIRLAPMFIEEGQVRYLDERTGTVFAADNVNLRIVLPTPESPLALKGSAVWHKERAAFSLFVKSPQRLVRTGSALEATVTARLLEAGYTGLVSLSEGFDLAGRLEAKSPSLRDLMSWLGAPMPAGRGLAAFSVRAALDLSPDRISLKKAELKLDGMTARGFVRIKTSGKRPFISASLGVDRIDVNPYLAPQKKDTGSGGGKAAPAGWSRAPVDFATLKGIDGELRLVASEIRYRDVRIGRSELTAKLAGGVLDANLRKMAFYGGSATGRLVLDGNAKKPVMKGVLDASGVNGLKLLRDFAGLDSLQGRLDVALSVAAAGRSQLEMVSTLNGTARLRFADGAVRGVNIARMVRQLKKAVIEGWKKSPDEKTDFAELSASFRIRDGIAESSDLKMLGPLVRLTGKGEVDLLRRYLDWRMEPKLVATLKGQGGKQELTGLPVPVIVRGPWSNPKIYPDIKGILKDPEAAYKSLSRLIGKAGNVDIDKVRDKAGAVVKKQSGKLEGELEKTIGEDNTKKVKKKAKKLLKKLLQ